MAKTPLILGVLASGSGRTLQNFIELQAAGHLETCIGVVIASRPGLGVLDKAAAAGLRSFVVDPRTFPSPRLCAERIFSLLDAAAVDLVCLAGWLSLLEVPQAYRARVMNIHPALLPGFGGKGMYGHHVHQGVLDAGCKISGCTVHFVDSTYDTGPIIVQRTCPVLEADSADTLAARVFEEEKLAYPQAIRLFQAGNLRLEGRRVRISRG